jgi:hypothetical protein
MTDAKEPDETEPVEGFDQTNGLAGDLVGDDDTEGAGVDDDAESDIGSIYTGFVNGTKRADDDDEAGA